jgi:hypothetical protein
VWVLKAIAGPEAVRTHAMRLSIARIERCPDLMGAYLTANTDAERRDVAQLIHRNQLG